MKKLATITAVALLAACSQEAPAPEADTADQTAMSEEATAPTEVMAADGQPAAGMYKVTDAEGKVWMENLKADGTYTSTDESGTVTETGRWVQKTPEQYCYTVDQQYVDDDTPAGEQCNTETVNADGVWTSTNSDGETVTVERTTA